MIAEFSIEENLRNFPPFFWACKLSSVREKTGLDEGQRMKTEMEEVILWWCIW